MKANSEKSHIVLSCSKASGALFDGYPTESNTEEILLGIITETELKCDEHVRTLCKIHVKNLMFVLAL